MFNLESIIDALEAKDGDDPQLIITRYILEIMVTDDASIREDGLNAAYFLLSNGILEKPIPEVCLILDARYQGDRADWPESRAFFGAAQRHLENKLHDDPRMRENLCFMAVVYYAVFQGAPLGATPQAVLSQRQWELKLFVGRLLNRALPPSPAFTQGGTPIDNCELYGVWFIDNYCQAVTPDAMTGTAILAALRAYESSIERR